MYIHFTNRQIYLFDICMLRTQDKSRLREQLISQLNITHSSIAKQMGVIVAKIARTDWPGAYI